MRKIPLHIKILIGLILGIIFGSIFRIEHNSLLIQTTQTEKISDWREARFTLKDSVLKAFAENSQMQIIKYSDELKKNSQLNKIRMWVLFKDGNSKTFENIVSIKRESSLGYDVKPIGDIFIRLLNMIAVPLVLASLIVGAASLHDLKHVAKLGGKMLGLFLLTAIISVSLGQTLAVLINPGSRMSPETRTELVDSFKDEVTSTTKQDFSFNVVDFLTNIVPKNPFKGLVEGDFLQIVFFALLMGLVLVMLPKEKSQPVIKFFEGITQAMIKMVEKVVMLAPFAVFALISATIAEFGFSILQTLFWYVLTVLLGLAIVTFVLYPVIVKFKTGISIIDFFKVQKQIFAVAFTTSSSSATLPITLDVAETKLGIPNKIASFVIPVGTTINKDGTALYQAVAAIFIAQVYGIDLSFAQQLSIFITCVITGAATPPVAGAGLIMLYVVMQTVGLPGEGIALVIGVDRLLNMSRAVTNVIGDTMAGVVLAKSEGELGEIQK